jgi:hypothetical protein
MEKLKPFLSLHFFGVTILDLGEVNYYVINY